MSTLTYAPWSRPAQTIAEPGSPGRSAHWVPRPGPVWGAYPMRAVPEWPEHADRAWWMHWRQQQSLGTDRQRRQLIDRVLQATGPVGSDLSTPPQDDVVRVRAALVRDGLVLPSIEPALGLVIRLIQHHHGLTPRANQLQAVLGMLSNGLVELPTGEGKTLVAVMTAAVAALAGVPVHVLTSNDYLAQRDAQAWREVYESLGLRWGVIQAPQTSDERRAIYRCDVVYASAREVAFDHLRDRQAMVSESTRSPGGALMPAQGASVPVLRGLCMAILDEADSLLIDEATMPMILAQEMPDQDVQQHRQALFLARQMQLNEHVVEARGGAWTLTEAGRDWLTAKAHRLGGHWHLRRWREELVMMAMTALHTYQRDVHYVVHDDDIQIVDTHTGRRAPGRHWSRGLHQLVALKEGLTPCPPSCTVQQLSYQQLFPRYWRLCGQSGTLWESRRELMSVYGLPVWRVPPHQPSRLQHRAGRLFRTREQMIEALASRVQALHAQALPVLVGTRSVAEAEAVSTALHRRGLPQRCLHARDDADEEGVVAQAGRPGAITVATQLAGRGTDIRLDEATAQAGGLQVLSVGLSRSARIDRQLAGRAGRCGQPGGHERWLYADDEVLNHAGALWRGLWRLAGLCAWPVGAALSQPLQHAWAQEDARQRWVALRQEARHAGQLAWSRLHPWDR